MTVTSPGNAELDGLALGNRNQTNQYLITNMQTMALPAVRSTVYTVSNQHGSFFPANDYYGPRSVILDMVILPLSGQGPGSIKTAMDNLMKKAKITDSDVLHNLDVWSPGDAAPWRYIGRTRSVQFPDEATTMSAGYANCSLRFDTERSYAVSPTLTTTTVNFAAGVAGGWSYPKTFTYTYGGTAASTAVITNNGNFPYEPLIRCYGPFTTLRIYKDQTGEEFRMEGSVNTGDYMEIDMRYSTAKLNGSTSRYGNVVQRTSTWFKLDPGTNTLRWTPSVGAGSSMTVYSRDARI